MTVRERDKFMEDIIILIKYLFLGVIQGFTEPIPISSSGHLVILQNIIDLQIDGLGFEVFVNFASLLAVLTIYRKDIIDFTTGAAKYIQTKNVEYKSDFNYLFYIVIATIPAGVIGVLFGDFIEDQLKGVKVIGITLIITGIALWIIRNLRGKKTDGKITLKDAIIIGFAQALALIPGMSQSGATIVAGMGLGLKQQTALRFSFLMFIPVSLGGIVLKLSDIVTDITSNDVLIPYALAFISCYIATYFSLKWFMGIMEKGNLKYFSYYCFIVGTLVIIFL